MDSNHNFSIGYKIWFEFNQDTLSFPILGEQKILLLKMIMETGSINSASDKMGMDFKKAHDMLFNIQEKLGDNLLFYTERGRQGGTKITLLGRKLIETYDNLNNLYNELTKQLNQLLADGYNSEKEVSLDEIIH